jgi:hypothetical protein
MDTAVVLLSVAYVVVAALLLNLNLKTSHAPRVKVAAIVVTTCLYIVSWFGYQAMSGWASTQPLPEQFRLLWVSIEERKREDRNPGYIYYWVRTLDEADLPVGPPRAHRVEWSETAAEIAEAATSAIEEGQELNGTLSRNLMAPSEEGDAISGYAGEQSVTGASDEEVNIRFNSAPPRHLPAKPAPG